LDFFTVGNIIFSVFYREIEIFIISLILFKEYMSENSNQGGSPIKPLGDRVIVRPLTEVEAGTVSMSGIIIPDTAKKEVPEQGIVIAVGNGKLNEDGTKRNPVEVKVGDKIIFSKYGFDEVKIDNKQYYIVGEASILGIFTK
jgi:chaperonin GroES